MTENNNNFTIDDLTGKRKKTKKTLSVYFTASDKEKFVRYAEKHYPDLKLTQVVITILREKGVFNECYYPQKNIQNKIIRGNSKR